MSYKSEIRKLLDMQHKQALADIETGGQEAIKSLIKNVQAATARNGMNFSSLEGDLTQEGQAPIEAEMLRNKNLENISYQQQIAALLKPTGGGSGGFTPGTNPFATTSTSKVTPAAGVQAGLIGGIAPTTTPATAKTTKPILPFPSLTGMEDNVRKILTTAVKNRSTYKAPKGDGPTRRMLV